MMIMIEVGYSYSNNDYGNNNGYDYNKLPYKQAILELTLICSMKFLVSLFLTLSISIYF